MPCEDLDHEWEAVFFYIAASGKSFVILDSKSFVIIVMTGCSDSPWTILGGYQRG